jgi:hypothetical protein
MDANITNLNTDKVDVTDWPVFVGTGAGEINVTNAGGATAITATSYTLNLEEWCDETYMANLLQILSAGELSNNQRVAIAQIITGLEAQISMILSKLESVT